MLEFVRVCPTWREARRPLRGWWTGGGSWLTAGSEAGTGAAAAAAAGGARTACSSAEYCARSAAAGGGPAWEPLSSCGTCKSHRTNCCGACREVSAFWSAQDE